MVRPGNKLHIGTKVIFGDGLIKGRNIRHIARWDKKSKIYI